MKARNEIMLKPRPLRRGDTIGLVGISGAMHDPETKFDKMLAAIDALGYKVIVADNCREEYGYLQGTDAARAKGLNQMFRDDRVDAVVCMRGGYGVARMLDLVDFDAMRANPKLVLGYSDITALHTAIHQKVGMVTMHGPMPATAWMDFDDFTRDSMLRALESTEPLGRISNPPGMEPRGVVPGRCEGLLVGGNLTLIASACGTPYALDARDKVLLLEDIIRDIIVPAGKPVLANMSIGHTPTKITVPLGVRCAVDAGAGTLEFLESALED